MSNSKSLAKSAKTLWGFFLTFSRPGIFRCPLHDANTERLYDQPLAECVLHTITGVPQNNRFCLTLHDHQRTRIKGKGRRWEAFFYDWEALSATAFTSRWIVRVFFFSFLHIFSSYRYQHVLLCRHFSELKRRKNIRTARQSDWSLWLPLTECVELQHGGVNRINVLFKGDAGSHSESGAANTRTVSAAFLGILKKIVRKGLI